MRPDGGPDMCSAPTWIPSVRIDAAVLAFARTCADRSETADASYRAWVDAAEACTEDEKIEVNRRIEEM